MSEPERKYDLAFYEVREDLGLTLGQIKELSDKLYFLNEDGGRMLPLEVENQLGCSVAIGFITEHIAEELDYLFDGVKDFVQSILEDTSLESEDCSYTFDGCNIYIAKP